MLAKKCDLDCELEHEGYCTAMIRYNINPRICNAKTNDDLIEVDDIC